jgi:flagellar biosynthesis protein FlhB
MLAQIAATDPDFASLWMAAERGSEIPLAAFAAVVEVLACLYQLAAAAAPGSGAAPHDAAA